MRFVYPSATSEDAAQILATQQKPVSYDFQNYTFLANELGGALTVYNISNESDLAAIEEDLEDFIERSFMILDSLIRKFKEAPSKPKPAATEEPRAPKTSHITQNTTASNDSEPLSPLEMIRQYFATKEFRFKERTSDSGQKSFVFGVRTDAYRDKDDDESIIMVISIMDDNKLIRIDAVNCYSIYKDIDPTDSGKVFKRYQKAALLMTYLQYEYKLVKYWTDHNDGEVRMRFDFPLEAGQLDFSQINRQVNSLVSIADDAHPKFMSYVFNDDGDDVFERNLFIPERQDSYKENLMSSLVPSERLKKMSIAQLEALQKSILAQVDKAEQTGNEGI